MKRFSLFLAILLLLLCCPSVYASESKYVDDGAALLNDTDLLTLCDLAENALSQTGASVVVVTRSSIGYRDVQDYADLYFEEHFGYGDGVLFLLTMEEREWAVSTSGNVIDCFPDYRLDELEYSIVPLLSDGAYTQAFEQFISLSTSYLLDPPAEEERSLTAGSYPVVPVAFFSLVIGLIVGLIGTSILKGKMKSVAPKHDASGYIRQGSFQLTRETDTFLYSNISKTPRAQSGTSGRSGGSGGGVHFSSSGHSHGGRSGHF